MCRDRNGRLPSPPPSPYITDHHEACIKLCTKETRLISYIHLIEPNKVVDQLGPLVGCLMNSYKPSNSPRPWPLRRSAKSITKVNYKFQTPVRSLIGDRLTIEESSSEWI